MKEKIYNFYSKNGVFMFFALVSMIGWLAWGISNIAVGGAVKLTVFAFIFLSLTGGMLIAYIKGETNVQKMFFGSLLIFFIIDYIEIVDVFFTYKLYPIAIINSIILALLIAFFVCHVLQQLDHVGRPIIQVLNQICGFTIAFVVVFLIACISSDVVTATDYTFSVATVMTLALIICMETRINKYKQLRKEYKASGNWNDETRKEAKKIFKI